MNDEKNMIRELMEVNGYRLAIPERAEEQRELLKTLMTISKPAKLSDQYYKLEKRFIAKENANKVIVPIDSIEEQLTKNIYIFQGDITTIEADAIVNAANEKLLGCFIPGHHCIDNAIHMSAGLGLRNECNEIMVATGIDEAVGQAKVTKAYNLPSSYVVHTVGPNLNHSHHIDFEKAKEQLASCYIACLKAVNNYEDIKNIVFCSISTGVYGFPIDLASKIAIETIETYLNTKKHHLNKVVIDVFSEEDYHVYKNNATNRYNKNKI